MVILTTKTNKKSLQETVQKLFDGYVKMNSPCADGTVAEGSMCCTDACASLGGNKVGSGNDKSGRSVGSGRRSGASKVDRGDGSGNGRGSSASGTDSSSEDIKLGRSKGNIGVGSERVASNSETEKELTKEVKILRDNQAPLQHISTIKDVHDWLVKNKIEPLQLSMKKVKIYDYEKTEKGTFKRVENPKTGKMERVKLYNEDGSRKSHMENKIVSESPAKRITELVKNEDFMALPVFDRARIAAQFERRERPNDYSGSFRINHGNKGNMKMTDKIEFGDKKISIIGADTIQGCDQMCYECYANKMAYNINHQNPVRANLNGTIFPDEVIRIGTNGEPAKDWKHTADEVKALMLRSNDKLAAGGTSVSPEENVYFISKMLSIDGWDPTYIKNVEVSMDPLYPDHMRQTMVNVARIKTQYPDTNFVLRIRSVNSEDPAMMYVQDEAIKFANTMGLPVLETKLRFAKETSIPLLKLNTDENKPPFYEKHLVETEEVDDNGNKITKKENQFKVSTSILRTLPEKPDNLSVCNEKNIGAGACSKCQNCYKLMTDKSTRESNIAKSNEVMKHLDIQDFADPTAKDVTGYGGTVLKNPKAPKPGKVGAKGKQKIIKK
jgi:hypothetical protein